MSIHIFHVYSIIKPGFPSPRKIIQLVVLDLYLNALAKAEWLVDPLCNKAPGVHIHKPVPHYILASICL